ncbi:hypothetical protein M378DRAFT_12902 [Amanita muscaria Koide BX008]|uniref:Uncharacterized protein n=1 Tax=Amanita muscaria (strain Koide BX008) TaxID=946122 RepID=A0A0C2WL66_AMAMK|nr:hypothetical protein M378DRAFT_12902 [Amanita muscaria Koide BX008]
MDEERLAALQQENGLASALALFETPAQVARIFAQLGSRKDTGPTSMTYKYLIQAYTNAGDIKSANHYRLDSITEERNGDLLKAWPSAEV